MVGRPTVNYSSQVGTEQTLRPTVMWLLCNNHNNKCCYGCKIYMLVWVVNKPQHCS